MMDINTGIFKAYDIRGLYPGEINEAVVEFAREQGYDLIVPSPVVYASPKADITDRILDRLRRQSATGALP